MNELALFAGGGGGLLGSKLLGWTTVCACEIDPYARDVLLARQRDGLLERFPIWDDVRTFDGHPWRGRIDVVSGGFPCQDISSAGRGRGIDGPKSGLFREMLRIIGEVRPRFVFAENSPMLRTRGLDRVVSGLTDLGYCVRWGVLGARHVGAPHRRDRMWIVADADDDGERVFAEHAEVGRASADGGDVDLARAAAEQARSTVGAGVERAASNDATDPDSKALRLQQGRGSGASRQGAPVAGIADWWREHRFAGVDDGLAHRVDRVRVTGNGQVPHVAWLAARVLGG